MRKVFLILAFDDSQSLENMANELYNLGVYDGEQVTKYTLTSISDTNRCITGLFQANRTILQ